MSRWLPILMLVVIFATPTARAHDDPRRTPVVEAVERATPAVVTIHTEVQAQSPFLAFRPEARASEGSGVIIHPEGVVLTNAHVVDGARSIRVSLSDGRRFEADVVAQDADIDLAVLRLTGSSALPTIPLGDSDDLLLGEPAIAIGNPYGLGLTVSTGVIASTGRDVSAGPGPTQTYIQTDAAINPGNSGGALVNIRGELVGINTFIHSAAEGIGFAIPVNRVRKISADLLAFGTVQVPWLGVSVLDVGRGRLRGALADGAVLVQRVHEGGPGAAAGLVPGDLIHQIDGHRVLTRADLNARLAERSPGASIRVDVLRDRDAHTLTVRTRRAPEALGRDVVAEGLGVRLVETDDGLQVSRASQGGAWARAGLRPGDVLVGLDGRRVRTVAQLEALLADALSRHRASAWVTVARGPYRGTLELTL